MPEMDGYEATRRIRRAELQSGGRVPVVALTADAMADSKTRCEQAGMDDFLTKPLKKINLQRVLDRWIR